jgi:phosphoribosylaminoimidazole (AIR) synthetase
MGSRRKTNSSGYTSNGYSSRDVVTLAGYRVLEALKALEERSKKSLVPTIIRLQNIQSFLTTSGFITDIKHISGELSVLDTLNKISSNKIGKERSYSLTIHGIFELSNNPKNHSALSPSDQQLTNSLEIAPKVRGSKPAPTL